jgi:predicted glycogen debranching enzyme
VLRDIIAWHLRGTRFGIGVDPQDGLLHAGGPGVQLTWMDAKVGDWVVTPRIGKPVEINALWYNALRILSAFLEDRGEADAPTYRGHADRAQASFLHRFAAPDRLGLADLVDGPAGDDWTLRPNQIFSVSLPYPIVSGPKAAEIVDLVARELLTPVGLRTLPRSDPNYHGAYTGDRVARDGAYHQGTAWSWLMGPFLEAWYRVHGDMRAVQRFLHPVALHLRDAGLGSISEIFDADPPFTPRGAIAQAWGVAEILRLWRLFNGQE